MGNLRVAANRSQVAQGQGEIQNENGLEQVRSTEIRIDSARAGFGDGLQYSNIIDTCSVPVLQNTVMINKNSIKFEKISDRMYDLHFTYSSSQDLFITVYFLVQEVFDKSTLVTCDFNELYEGTSCAKQFKLPGGKGLELPPRSFLLDFRNVFPYIVQFLGSRQDKYGLVIQCDNVGMLANAIDDDQDDNVSAIPLMNGSDRVYYLFANFLLDEKSELTGIKIEKQKMDIGGRSSFLLEEIYGLPERRNAGGGAKSPSKEEEEEIILHPEEGLANTPAPPEEEKKVDKDCVVCCSERVDSVIMTCRHMILCQRCSKQVRDENKKCPLCREPVKSIIHLKLKEEIIN